MRRNSESTGTRRFSDTDACCNAERRSVMGKRSRLMRCASLLRRPSRSLNLLVEGVGINAASRIAGVNKETILKLLVKAGERCEKLMGERMQELRIRDVEIDEIWGFVLKKERHVKPTDNHALVGDQYAYVSLDRDTKLVISFMVGKRDVAQHGTF